MGVKEPVPFQFTTHQAPPWPHNHIKASGPLPSSPRACDPRGSALLWLVLRFTYSFREAEAEAEAAVHRQRPGLGATGANPTNAVKVRIVGRITVSGRLDC